MPVTLLLGPTPLAPRDTRVAVRRFRTTADLEAALLKEFPRCDTLIMAAAVADYRPVSGSQSGKLSRSEGRMSLELEATPDLLAACAARRRPGQRLIGFALEPADRLMASALRKLERKGLDAIVANPLPTMDSDTIEATFLRPGAPPLTTPGAMSKTDFAAWLLDRIDELR